MKFSKLLLTLTALLTLSGCKNSQNASENSNSSYESSLNSEDDNWEQPEEVDDGWVVSYIHVDEPKKILPLSEKSYYITFQFCDKDGNSIYNDLSEEEQAFEFFSTDESVAEVSSYGKITPKKAGKTLIRLRTLYKERRAQVAVTIVNSLDDLTYEYQRVEKNEIDSLAAGDVIVFGVSSLGVTATSDVTAGDLHSTPTTFSGNKIDHMGDGTAEFIVGGSYNQWTLETEIEENGKTKQKYLVAFNLNRVGFVNKTGNTEWEIGVDPDDNNMYVQSHANVMGWMMYNMDTQRFSLYDSNETQRMKLVEIYRETIIEN